MKTTVTQRAKRFRVWARVRKGMKISLKEARRHLRAKTCLYWNHTEENRRLRVVLKAMKKTPLTTAEFTLRVLGGRACMAEGAALLRKSGAEYDSELCKWRVV